MKRGVSVHSNNRSSVSAKLGEEPWEHYMNIGKRLLKDPKRSGGSVELGTIGILGHPTRSEEGGTEVHGKPTKPKRGRPKCSGKKIPTEAVKAARKIPPTEQNPEPKRQRGRPKGSKNKRPASATIGQLEHPGLDAQLRQDAESGQNGNRSSAKDEKKELNRLSQEYLRKFRKVLDNGGSEWGEYSTEFRYPAKGEELYKFLQELDGIAEYVHTWSDEVLRRARTRDQYGGRLNQWTWEKVLKEDFARDTDVISVDSMDDLRKALAGEFRKPIFHRARRGSTGETIYSLVDSGGFDLERFLADRKEFHANDHVDVHDMSEENTIRTKMKTLFDAFEPTSNVRPPQNFLSLENLTQHTFCPEAIAEHNLRTRIEKTSTRAAAAPPHSTSPEFFIASTANTISPIHIDSGGGNTWISMLSGRKIWYFPRAVDESTVRLLESADNLHAADYYPRGWAKLELRPGDALVMPPAFPHAVFTPDPSLAVGGQFYTAPHLTRSLRS
ncbi:putative domain family histone demethylase specific for h3-k36 [Diplodia seriata]|uniref:Putative domain family histone demethylase specific for h3-k36 n=1 Tax=Diplodia seriata TaxID=420778 RepID=A0A0G2E6W2_9PEZI|nr:putative domain family histone demethylase specific for h3-k36 [Diplodia seriata]